MKPTAYIETSVLSYLTVRLSRDVVVAAYPGMTREWWPEGSILSHRRLSLRKPERAIRMRPALVSRRSTTILLGKM